MIYQRCDIRMRDPYVLPLPQEGRYLLFGTTDVDPWAGAGNGFDCFSSRDLENWEGPIAAFRRPDDFWANTQFWAPECHAYHGRYYLLASFARDRHSRGTQILISEQPQGPYRLHSDGPVTPRDWECLDGTLFVDDTEQPWLIFCHEWLQVEDGEICAIPLSNDLSRATGIPTLLFRASAAAWSKPFESEGRGNNRVTDGPFFYRGAADRLFMIWSTGGEAGYTLGYAVSAQGNILGPWQQSATPLFARDGGHGMIFRAFDGRLLLSLHQPNDSPNERPLWMEIAERDGEMIVVE